jgi:protein involved in polysaccharide export with SLBB domain/Mrp family chromosome partitioning ATPase
MSRQESEIGLPVQRPKDVGPGVDSSFPTPPACVGRTPNRSWPVRFALLTLLFAMAGLAHAIFTRPYAASVRLFAFERRFVTKVEAADFSASVTAHSALTNLQAMLPPEVSTQNLAERCRIEVEPDQSFLTATATAKDAASARVLVEHFAAHVARCADNWVSIRGDEGERQIAAAQRRLQELRGRIVEATPTVAASVASTPVPVEEPASSAEAMALRTVQQELAQALTRFTEEHPRVKELRASIAALQREMANQSAAQTAARSGTRKDSSSGASARTPSKLIASEVEQARLKAEYSALSTYRDQLIQARVLTSGKDSEKWRQAEQVVVVRVTEPARLISHYTIGAFGGLFTAAMAFGVSRFRRRTIHDRDSLEEATQLPVLAVVPELEGLSETQKDYWAVETLNLIRRTARADRRGCFVCGVISATNGEGRSTVIDLLASAGLRTGNRVLVVPTPDFHQAADAVVTPPPTSDMVAVARQTLVLEAGNNALPVHWERAFTTWQHEENALVLVELPPATTADALVYSAGVPNVLWLGAARVADSKTTTRCVNSLRNSGCHFIGAALNMCSSIQKRAALWVALVATLAAFSDASAQTSDANPPTNGISATKVPVLAPWQERLTVGPGDALEISLYGQKDTTRQIVIGPDGRFSFLQAMDFTASGLTVDELRTQLEQQLMKFHLAPRVVILPAAFRSKKYFLLGNVQGRGAYPLDKPVTIVEAVARARGFVTAAPQRSSFTLTDFSQAFLMRRQPDGSFAREAVDFESLFQRGELQHNKLLAPDDYLYFPPTGLEEVYVLGSVAGTGPLPYSKDLTVLGAIAGRGGFTDAAWKERILVVRGSLNKPETFVVNMGKTLRAVEKDFALQPKDIVYVSRKPWAKAEELLEAASSDFMRAIAVTWTGRQIGPLTK